MPFFVLKLVFDSPIIECALGRVRCKSFTPENARAQGFGLWLTHAQEGSMLPAMARKIPSPSEKFRTHLLEDMF